MKKLTCVLLFYCVLFNNLAFSQNISGYITDYNSSEPLINANVFSSNIKYTTSSNEFGFFSLKLPDGASTQLIFSYLGYKSDTIEVTNLQESVLQIRLIANLDLPTIEVKATNQINTFTSEITPLSVEQLKAVPALLGETDIIRALSLTPGVSIGAEGTTGLFVRGGTPDQNLILLDGATVYNASHLFGFLSVFNPDAVKNVRLLKAGFLPEYGGRLSSILDVNMKEGNRQRTEKSFSIGLLSSRFMWEGPIKKERSSFMLSARTSYLSLLTVPVKIMFNNGNRNYHDGYWLYDLNGKINFKLTDKDQLFASFYGGQDFYENLIRDEGKLYNRSLHWGNQTGSLRYIRQINSNLFAKFQLSYNRYNYQQENQIGDISDNESVVSELAIINSSGIQDVSLKSDFSWTAGLRQHWNAGIELAQHRFTPGLLETEFGADILREVQLEIQPQEAATYINNRIQWNDNWRTSIGLRYVFYNTEEKLYQFLEPRLSVQFLPQKKQQWSYSFSKMTQPIHLLTSNSIGLPNDIWYPSTGNLPPQISYQNSLSYKQQIPSWQTTLTLSTYYKILQQQVDYREGINLATANEDWQNLLETDGIGRAYGGEVFLQKEVGRWNGWLSYTLSWNDRQFATINQGRWYPHRYDRRHDLSVVANYQLTKQWQVAANFVYSTGNAVTLPTAHLQNDVGIIIPIYTSRNNERLPAYHRLDLSFTRTRINKKGRETQLNFSIYNAYARKNANYIYRRTSFERNSEGLRLLGQQKISYGYRSLFSVIPSVSYSIKLQ